MAEISASASVNFELIELPRFLSVALAAVWSLLIHGEAF